MPAYSLLRASLLHGSCNSLAAAVSIAPWNYRNVKITKPKEGDNKIHVRGGSLKSICVEVPTHPWHKHQLEYFIEYGTKKSLNIQLSKWYTNCTHDNEVPGTAEEWEPKMPKFSFIICYMITFVVHYQGSSNMHLSVVRITNHFSKYFDEHLSKDGRSSSGTWVMWNPEGDTIWNLTRR